MYILKSVVIQLLNEMIWQEWRNSLKENGKKVKRILALSGAVILALMYVLTLIFAIADNPATMSYFKASVALTIAVPVMIYGYQLVYRVLSDFGKGKNESTGESDISVENKDRK